MIGGLIYGQDAHFSQFYNSQLSLNPALTGSSIGNTRLTANYRNQWGSVSKFQNMAFAADMSIFDKEGDNFGGVGLYAVNEQAGVNGFSISKVFGSFAYHNAISKNAYLAFGAQTGIYSIGYNSSDITTDAMWQNGFDETATNGENFETGSQTSLDINAGLLYYSFIGDKGMLFAGASAFHLLKPSNSFLEGEASEVPRKFLFHTGLKYAINDDFNLFPKVIFMTQGGANELNLGTSVEYDISDHIYKVFAVGLWYRNKDAVIAMASVEYNNIKIGISYDINTSDLSSVTNNRGGLELSLTYNIPKPNKRTTNLTPHNPRY